MEKLLFIDACIREELSRTLKIATPIVEKLKEKYEVETLRLNKLNLQIVNKELVNQRSNGNIDEEVMFWACKVRDAKRIVIAAPFWDMSFPAALKNFFELCSIFNVTFCTNDKTCYGNCNAEKLLYITTRGMDIHTGETLDGATPYLKALMFLWGIKELSVIEATNMDYVSQQEIDKKINKAIEEGLKLAVDF